ncbi:hypothetical protein [Candidatus Nitrosotenuis aquarius]|uniref:hypothetical protein n=1 Tax=Candidatus Nitrosotenuis aquarius TaxID=1846278 RepID=UPI000C1F3738|nr:hypothetical protein [Candidatus Nitrosotenuis aquarius]
MARGLDKRQKKAVGRSEHKIIKYVSKHEPVLFRQIVSNSGLQDHKTVRKRLSELIAKKQIGTTKLVYTTNKNKGREFYFSIPPSKKISDLLLREDIFRKIGTDKYYYGIRDDVPLPVQAAHKLRLLMLEFQRLKQKFDSKSNCIVVKIRDSDGKSMYDFESSNAQLLIDFAAIVKSSTSDSYFGFKEYYDSVLRDIISKMDDMFQNYKILYGNGIFDGPIKTIIARLLIENTKSGAASQLPKLLFGDSKIKLKKSFCLKIASEIERELFNKDGSPNIDRINQNNINTIGVKEYLPLILSGEALYEIWKNNTKA